MAPIALQRHENDCVGGRRPATMDTAPCAGTLSSLGRWNMEGRKPTLCGTRHSGFEGWKKERKFGVGLQVVMEPFCAPRIRCAFGDVRRETRTLEGSTIVVDIVFTRATESVR